jgi:hypothetical protein
MATAKDSVVDVWNMAPDLWGIKRGRARILWILPSCILIQTPL